MNNQAIKGPPIPLEDYCRIFRTIYSVLVTENAKITHSCIWFSLIGAAILHEHYKLHPKVFMGMAAYMVDEGSQTVLTFAVKKGDRVICSEEGFHSWILADNFIIDFTSPLFPKMISTPDGKSLCEPQMFQRHVKTMATDTLELSATGDFFVSPDLELTNNLIDDFVKVPLNMDILNICSSWYRRPPSEMPQMIGTTNGGGVINNVHLQPFQVTGAW